MKTKLTNALSAARRWLQRLVSIFKLRQKWRLLKMDVCRDGHWGTEWDLIQLDASGDVANAWPLAIGTSKKGGQPEPDSCCAMYLPTSQKSDGESNSSRCLSSPKTPTAGSSAMNCFDSGLE